MIEGIKDNPTILEDLLSENLEVPRALRPAEAAEKGKGGPKTEREALHGDRVEGHRHSQLEQSYASRRNVLVASKPEPSQRFAHLPGQIESIVIGAAPLELIDGAPSDENRSGFGASQRVISNLRDRRASLRATGHALRSGPPP